MTERKPVKISVTKEWCEAAARAEQDYDITVGVDTPPVSLAAPRPTTEWRMKMLLPVPVTEIIRALEGEAGNTDTDPRWLAASELRRMGGWERRTLMCDVDTRLWLELERKTP